VVSVVWTGGDGVVWTGGDEVPDEPFLDTDAGLVTE